MKRICLITGNLNGKEAASLMFLNNLHHLLTDNEYKKDFINLISTLDGCYQEYPIKVVAGADVVIFAFSLDPYGLPEPMMKFLVDYYLYLKSKSRYHKEKRVYAIINDGHSEPGTNEEIIRVIQNICRRLKINFRFAVLIGGGFFTVSTQNIPLLKVNLKKALVKIAMDIKGDEFDTKEPPFIKPIMPKAPLFKLRDKNWLKNHVPLD